MQQYLRATIKKQPPSLFETHKLRPKPSLGILRVFAYPEIRLSLGRACAFSHSDSPISKEMLHFTQTILFMDLTKAFSSWSQYT